MLSWVQRYELFFNRREKKYTDSTTISGCKRWVIVVLSIYFFLVLLIVFLTETRETQGDRSLVPIPRLFCPLGPYAPLNKNNYSGKRSINGNLSNANIFCTINTQHLHRWRCLVGLMVTLLLGLRLFFATFV